jgi:hypothetical protein
MKPLIKTLTREKGVEKCFPRSKEEIQELKFFSNKFSLIYTIQNQWPGSDHLRFLISTTQITVWETGSTQVA